MNTHKSIARLGSTAVAAGVALGMAVGLRADAVPDPPAKTITDYVNCVNTTLMNLNTKEPVSIADTVSCLPPKCSVIVTKSARSDQPASSPNLNNGATLEFPRLIFTCPGSQDGLKLRPAYTLGADRSAYRNLEVAEDTKKDAMIMATIRIEGPGSPTTPTIAVGKFMNIIDNNVKNMPTGKLFPGKPHDYDVGDKMCNVCHFDVGKNDTVGKNPEFLLSKPIDPLSAKAVWRVSNDNLKALVLFENIGDLTKTPDLGCDNLNESSKNLLTPVPAPDLAVIIRLCKNLMTYKP